MNTTAAAVAGGQGCGQGAAAVEEGRDVDNVQLLWRRCSCSEGRPVEKVQLLGASSKNGTLTRFKVTCTTRNAFSNSELDFL